MTNNPQNCQGHQKDRKSEKLTQSKDLKWMDGITELMDMSLSKLRELVMDKESLACCSPWGHKELDTIERLN